MSVFQWILLGLGIISTGLYITGSIIKKSVMEKVSSCFILPSVSALSLLFLITYLPDSLHTLIISSVALTLTSIAEILFIFEHIKKIRGLFRFIFLLSVLCWADLYKEVFFIARVPAWFSIIVTIFYACLIAGCLILCGKQKFFKYFNYLCCLLAGISLHYSSFIQLCFVTKASAVMLFCGTTITLGLIIFYTLDYAKFNFKNRKYINLGLLIISQALISFSNVLMFAIN